MGLVAATNLANIPLVYASYPITPASDILHSLCEHRKFGVRTIQAEDEIAAMGMAIGAKVTADVVLESVESRRLVFRVSVTDAHGLVAVGRITRVAVQRDRFLERAKG